MFERARNYLRSLRRVGGFDLPDAGRSSVEGTLSDRIASMLGGLGTVSPVIDFEMLRLLKHLWITNPDLSQYVANAVNLGNTGHKIIVDARSSQRAEAAAMRLNEAASRLYRLSAGVDGLMNDYLAQIAWSGALSSEDVVDFGARRVAEVVLVPVEQIRFRLIDGQYRPFQHATVLDHTARSPLGLVELNEETYHYLALQRVENSPYAKPPATAAVASIVGPQKDMIDNVKFIARKLGLLGLVAASVAPPPKQPKEDESAYQKRATAYLARVNKALEANFNKGLLTHFRDQEIKHTNVAGDARGAADIFSMNEQQVFSGMGTFPAFHGRTDSTTETYAFVVYQFMLAQAASGQRLVKRRQEATCRLDLLLGGVEVDAVNVVFNRAHALNPLEEAQAEQAVFETAKEKAECGMISPDEAAQECGYESAFDPELMNANPEVAKSLRRMGVGAGRAPGVTATFRFDRGSQRYRFVPERIELGAEAAADAGDAGNVFRLKKKLAA